MVLPFVCVHNNTQEWKNGEKRERPGSIHHMSGVRWMRGGGRGKGSNRHNNALDCLSALLQFCTPDISVIQITRLDQ